MAHPVYLDFELAITMADDARCTVTVIHSPAGEAQTTAALPVTPAQLLADPPGAPLATVQSFGSALFDAVISGEVRSRYDVSRQMAAAQEKGLRIKLRIGATALLGVAWELLYDARTGEFVCLSRQTPLVRYVAIPQPIQPLIVRPPLRILGMVAGPHGAPPLDVASEKTQLATAIAPLRSAGLVELTWLEGQTWRALQQTLQTGPWHIFHFVGHAGFDETADAGFLLLADERDEIAPLYAAELARLLADQQSLRLAVLNACASAQVSEAGYFASTAATLVRRGLPAILAMQYALSDAAAVECTRSFYSALAALLPVDAALSEARKAMSLSRRSAEWATPVLYLRAPDGILWQANQEKETMSPTKTPAWWDQLPENLGGFEAGDIGGSVIIGTVGAGAKNIAIGQNITQIIAERLGPPSSGDKMLIDAHFAQIMSALDEAAIEPRTAGRAEVHLETLQTELAKTGDDEQPDGGAIIRAGDWLFDNTPEIAQALGELFGLPAVGRIVGKAGERVLQWVRKRFG